MSDQMTAAEMTDRLKARAASREAAGDGTFRDTAAGRAFLRDARLMREAAGMLPNSSAPVVCICGSTRFRVEITDANRRLTLGGNIVVAPGVFGHDGDAMTEEQKLALDALHFKKIDLAEGIYVVNPGGYVGESTAREIAYATETGKSVWYLEGTLAAQSESPERAAA